MKSPRIFTEARFKLESASERTAVLLWFYTHSAEGHELQVPTPAPSVWMGHSDFCRHVMCTRIGAQATGTLQQPRLIKMLCV